MLPRFVRVSLTFLLILCCAGFSFGSSSLLLSDNFQNIKNSLGERLVVFYFSSDSKAESVLTILEKAAKRIRKTLPQFQFYKCDGDLSANVQDFAEAQFNSGYFIFSSVPVEGILKYTGEVNVNAIVNYIQSKYLPSNEEDVLNFTDEYALFNRMDETDYDDEGQPILRPAFLWFTETWCDMCKRLRPALTIAATYFSTRGVDVVEVKCSDNEATTEFCTRHQVRKFPTLILFSGETKETMSDETINVIQMEKFAEKHLLTSSDAANDSDDDRSDSWNAFQKIRQEESAEKKKSKKKSKSKVKKEETATGEEDAVQEEEELSTQKHKRKENAEKSKKGKFAKPASKKKEEKQEEEQKHNYNTNLVEESQQEAHAHSQPAHSDAVCSSSAGSAATCEGGLTVNGISELVQSLQRRIEMLESRVKRLEAHP